MNVPSNFLESMCAKISFVQHFTRTHMNLEWHVWNMCQNHFWKVHLCALQILLCALISWPQCALTRAQFRGNIGPMWIWGHPFMTSTRRGEREVKAQVDACGRGRGLSPMWTSTQKMKIRVHWRYPVFFSCKEVGVFFTRISSLDGIKTGTFSAI